LAKGSAACFSNNCLKALFRHALHRIATFEELNTPRSEAVAAIKSQDLVGLFSRLGYSTGWLDYLIYIDETRGV
jgi:hypothetical protein